MTPGITVVVPTIPVRPVMFERAVRSVFEAREQMCQRFGDDVPIYLHTPLDARREGAAVVRHRGLLDVRTAWVAFLDDDDAMHPDHLVELYSAALEHQADYVWSRFQIRFPDGRTFQGPQFLGEKAFQQWNDDDPCQTTVTTLVRTQLALDAGGFLEPGGVGPGLDSLGNRIGEDYQFAIRCRKAGGAFRHVEKVTWDWWHHGRNTSGLPVW